MQINHARRIRSERATLNSLIGRAGFGESEFSMIAIVSDMHANLESTQAVLDDIHRFDVEAIYCLGDIVGYGPNPIECLDMAMDFDVVLLGNHEQAMLDGPVGFQDNALRAAEWTFRQLDGEAWFNRKPKTRWEFLEGLPQFHQTSNLLFVHGSPRNPVREYVFPEDAKDAGRMWDIFRRVRRYCFMGHTHVPGIFTESGRFLSPEELGGVYPLQGRKILCNVGSVGQPRDGDPRACYVLVDRKGIHFRRIEYDVRTTVSKIKKIPELRYSLRNYRW